MYTIYMRHILYIIFICLSNGEHLDCFRILPIVNTAAVTIDGTLFIENLTFNFVMIYTLELDY